MVTVNDCCGGGWEAPFIDNVAVGDAVNDCGDVGWEAPCIDNVAVGDAVNDCGGTAPPTW